MNGKSGRVIEGIYVVGAVIDAIAAVALASPAGSVFRQLAYPGYGDAPVNFADGTRAAFPLMLGWTLLLVWGAIRPVERRGVLLSTMPVVAGFMAIEILDVTTGLASAGGTVATLMVQTVLLTWLVVAWRLANGIASNGSATECARGAEIRQGA